MKNHPFLPGAGRWLRLLTLALLCLQSSVAKAGLIDRVNVIMTAGNVPSILNYVALGMGVAILSRPATEALPVPADVKARFLHRNVSSFLGHDQVALLHPKGRHELAHVRAFREMVVKGLKADTPRKVAL